VRFASPLWRPVLGAVLAAVGIVALSFAPSDRAQAQERSISFIRDTEAEELLRSYVDPVLTVAGLQPSAVHVYLINDPSINAFVAEGQNMFIHTGLLMELKTPGQVRGVMAHETGHMAGGHLVRTQVAVRAAMVPMLLSVAAGIGAMIAGAGDAGAAIMMSSTQLFERELYAFTRTQESAADQAAVKYLTATKHSSNGIVEVFKRFEGEEIMVANKRDPFAYSHPASSERIAQLQSLVDASPFRDLKDSDEEQYAFDMVQAKLRGYVQRPEVTLRQYPATNTGKPARYARAMAYFRQPDMQKAMAEIDSLLAEEPENPYFLEMLGQIKVEMGKVAEGIEPYQQAVHIRPDAPLIRVALGAALLGTENPIHTQLARQELEKALNQENDNAFGWYELAEAYNRMGLMGKAQLATAERYFATGTYPMAMQFATRAQQQLERGSRDWQRANDIMAISQSQLPNRRN
jgi:predicted Zn-dependent protease